MLACYYWNSGEIDWRTVDMFAKSDGQNFFRTHCICSFPLTNVGMDFSNWCEAIDMFAMSDRNALVARQVVLNGE